MSFKRDGIVLLVYFENNISSCVYQEMEEKTGRLLWKKIKDYKGMLVCKMDRVKLEIKSYEDIQCSYIKKKSYCNLVQVVLNTFFGNGKYVNEEKCIVGNPIPSNGCIEIGILGVYIDDSWNDDRDGDCGRVEFIKTRSNNNLVDELSGYYLLKSLLQMIQDVLEVVEKVLNDRKFYCKHFYDVIINFLEKLSPFIVEVIQLVEKNYDKTWEYLVEFYNEDKHPSLEEITDFVLTILKGSKFEKIFDIYNGIKERRVEELVVDSVNLVLNVFAFLYTHFAIPNFVEMIKSGNVKRSYIISNNKRMVKGFTLLIIKANFSISEHNEINS